MKGHVKSEPLSHRTTDLTGQRFSRLFVQAFAGYYYAPCGQRYPLWECLCDCGQKCHARASDLQLAKCMSCGCLKNERIRARSATHGETTDRKRSQEYSIWAGMITRCTNPNEPCFRNYGGRGIKVCDRWRHSFENFLADVGRRPSSRHSLDRVNNDGHYEPGNVRWATRKEQRVNSRATRLLTFKGETLTIREWSRRIGCSHAGLYFRINAGWSTEEALTTPFRIGNRWRHKQATYL